MGVTVSDLPGINATLNATCAVLLVIGFVFIKRKQIAAHRACMIAAVVCSTAFLTSYLVYHAQVGSVKVPGTGVARTVYLTILATHTVLAAAIVPLVIVTLVRALRERFDQHRKIARLTLPIWLYVSVTGVVVYWMLYRMTWA
ncbi:MAG: DUF420 domain-containing protein [Planctomycetes bacterium]|nr:DUF420 domain-containing protein [Planctomycetota bacterium]